MNVSEKEKDEDDYGYITLCPLHRSAPELLRTLTTLVKMVEDGDWTDIELNEARAAIARAEGRE